MPAHSILIAPHDPALTDLPMGGTNPHGVKIAANSQYLTLGGRPWLPVMGEFHFSRYPRDQWQEELLKMKAGGAPGSVLKGSLQRLLGQYQGAGIDISPATLELQKLVKD